MLMGYARVSKSDGQDTATQISALKAAGTTKIFEEEQNQAKMDKIAQRYAEFDDILDSEQSDTDQLSTIRELIKSRPDLTDYARTHAEYGGKHAERSMCVILKRQILAAMELQAAQA